MNFILHFSKNKNLVRAFIKNIKNWIKMIQPNIELSLYESIPATED